jgi:hypothetical protein
MSAWIIGLSLATGGPSPTDTAATIAKYYDDHEVKAMVATLFIDGVAALAILGLAYSFWSYLAAEESRFRRAVLVAGLFAGIASVAQMVIGEVMAYRAAHGASDDSVETLFKVLNNLDT